MSCACLTVAAVTSTHSGTHPAPQLLGRRCLQGNCNEADSSYPESLPPCKLALPASGMEVRRASGDFWLSGIQLEVGNNTGVPRLALLDLAVWAGEAFIQDCVFSGADHSVVALVTAPSARLFVSGALTRAHVH